MAVLQLRVPSVRHEHDVLLHIFLHHKPGSAAQSQALALTDGVEPEAFVASHNLARLDVDDASLLLAHETCEELVVVDFPQKADALTVLAAGTGQMCFLSNAPHLAFGQMTDGEQTVAELLVCELCQKIRLVLHRVGSRAQPHFAVLLDARGIMPGCYKVVVVPHQFVECPELDETVAHHIGVGRKPFLHALYGVAHHALPIFLLQVGDGEREPILPCGGLREFYVLLGCA